MLIEPVEIAPQEPETKAKSSRPSPAALIALEALREAISEGGSVPSPSNHIPPGTRTVAVGMWRSYAYQRDPDGNAESRRKAFQRSRRDLQRHRLVGVWGTENGSEDDAQCWLTS